MVEAAIHSRVATKDFINELGNLGFSTSDDKLRDLLSHESFNGLDADKIRSAIYGAAQHRSEALREEFIKMNGDNVRPLKPIAFDKLEVSDVMAHMGVPKDDGHTVKEGSDKIRASMKRREAAARNTSKTATKEAESGEGFWHAFKNGEYDKVNLAVGLVAAGLSAFGALSTAGSVVTRDETGNTKINMTPLLWTLGQGAMAAGITYLTLKSPQLTNVATRG